MCFSAAASFTTTVLTGGTGIAAQTAVQDRRWRWYALIPLLFSLQQALEGIQWLLPKPGLTSTVVAYLYLVFAFLLWPSYVPFAVLKVEFRPRRKKFIRILWMIGMGVSVYLLGCLLTFPLSVMEFDHSIYYQIHIPAQWLMVMTYVLSACGSMAVSSRRWIKWSSLAAIISATISIWFWEQTFASVWCFFTAVLSIMVYLEVKHSQSTHPKK